MAKLILLQGGQATPYELTLDEVTLGRLPECDIQLQSNMVSRRHARVVRKEDGFVLEDLGSGNGSYVNGKRIEGSIPLKHDDRVKLGPVLLRFDTGEGPEESSFTALANECTTLSFRRCTLPKR